MTILLTTLMFSALFGGGVYLSIQAVAAPAASLQSELNRIDRSGLGPEMSTTERFGRFSATDVPSADLEALGWSEGHWFQRRLIFAVSGMAIGLLTALVLRIFFSFPLLLAIPALGLLMGGLGLVVVDSDRVTRANAQREEILVALSHFLEITSIMLAGGAGAETALEEAVVQGHGVGFRLFAREIARAKQNPGMSPFTALRNLGARLGIRELVEFGNVMILSSESSATVRQALDDKASQIIFREQEKRKSEALSRNVMMSLPVVGMAGGFILWLMYAALAGLTNL